MNLDEEEKRKAPCIQDRLRSAATRSKEIFASWPIICLTILVLIIITLPEILTLTIGRKVIIPLFSQISLEGRIGILFSFSVVLFSSVQYRSERKRNKIIDLRNELEKAYGPLYSLFNPLFMESWGIITEGEGIEITSIDLDETGKEKLDFILSNYPFMFKPEIYHYWREHLQDPARARTENNSKRIIFIIEKKFINMIYEEYHKRLEKYNNLLGRVQR